MNVIARQDFKLASFETEVHLFRHYTTRIPAKVEESSLLYYLLIAGGSIVGVIPSLGCGCDTKCKQSRPVFEY